MERSKFRFLNFSIILIVFSIVIISNAQIHHPYGHSITIQFDEDSNKKTDSNHDKLKEIFGHPEVEDRKVVILSIIGAYRKGKSFFLDYCLRFLYANYRSVNTLNTTFIKNENWWGQDDEPLIGFSWKHGSQPDTKGILFWNDVFLHEQNGEKIAIFLIDTQGLFESGADSNLDAKIFGATNFISSIQIFNIKDVIQEDQLEHLNMVTEFAKLTTKRQRENSLNSTFNPFQCLLFLFRDWDYEDIDYGYAGGQIYMSRFLNLNDSKNIKAQNVRDNIRKSYDNITAFLLPSPGKIVKKSQYDGRWGPLDEEFQEHFITLINSIFAPNNLVKKKIFGMEITAKELLDHAVSILSAFDGFDLPDTESVFAASAKIQLKKLSAQTIEEYFIKMNKSVDYRHPYFSSKLNSDHESIKLELIENFKKESTMANEEIKNEIIKLTIYDINDGFSKWKIHFEKLNAEHLAYLARLQRELFERKHQARLSYKKTAAYISCKIVTFGAHDCGMTNIVNNVT